MAPAEATARIQALLATPEGIGFLKNDFFIGPTGPIARNKDLPLSQRIELMTRLYDLQGDLGSEGWARREVMNLDYEEYDSGADSEELMRSFEDGGKDARQVAAEMAAALPDVMVLDPAAVRLRVLRRLMARDPERAQELLDDLPPQQRYEQAKLYAETSNADPQLVLRIYDAVPLDPSVDSLDSRKASWARATDIGLRRYEDRYAQWVESLPAGVNKDMALAALADRVAADHPEQAEALRAKISQPGADR
ncbi:MAG: hypothetical protein QM755_21875 [Luteolibacter sp.]